MCWGNVGVEGVWACVAPALALVFTSMLRVFVFRKGIQTLVVIGEREASSLKSLVLSKIPNEALCSISQKAAKIFSIEKLKLENLNLKILNLRFELFTRASKYSRAARACSARAHYQNPSQGKHLQTFFRSNPKIFVLFSFRLCSFELNIISDYKLLIRRH